MYVIRAVSAGEPIVSLAAVEQFRPHLWRIGLGVRPATDTVPAGVAIDGISTIQANYDIGLWRSVYDVVTICAHDGRRGTEAAGYLLRLSARGGARQSHRDGRRAREHHRKKHRQHRPNLR